MLSFNYAPFLFPPPRLCAHLSLGLGHWSSRWWGGSSIQRRGSASCHVAHASC
jgi:hypothetical protein